MNGIILAAMVTVMVFSPALPSFALIFIQSAVVEAVHGDPDVMTSGDDVAFGWVIFQRLQDVFAMVYTVNAGVVAVNADVASSDVANADVARAKTNSKDNRTDSVFFMTNTSILW